MHKATRVILLLFAVAVVTSVIAFATHHNPATPAANSPSDSTAPTTTSLSNATTTPGGAKPSLGNSKVTTTTQPIQYVLFNVQNEGNDTIGPFVITSGANQWNLGWTYSAPALQRQEL